MRAVVVLAVLLASSCESLPGQPSEAEQRAEHREKLARQRAILNDSCRPSDRQTPADVRRCDRLEHQLDRAEDRADRDEDRKSAEKAARRRPTTCVTTGNVTNCN
jgi:hypothetical protein